MTSSTNDGCRRQGRLRHKHSDLKLTSGKVRRTAAFSLRKRASSCWSSRGAQVGFRRILTTTSSLTRHCGAAPQSSYLETVTCSHSVRSRESRSHRLTMTSSKLYGPENRRLTGPPVNVRPRPTAVVKSVSPFAKKSSRPSRDHAGAVPPSSEICVRLPGPGNGRT